MITISNRDWTDRLHARRDDQEAAWRALECGEFSPLWAGDLSPSEAGTATKLHARLAAGASRGHAHSSPHARSFDGDKSPRKSGDESPHSKTRIEPPRAGAAQTARNRSSSGLIPNSEVER
jgi:hypothetical protein